MWLRLKAEPELLSLNHAQIEPIWTTALLKCTLPKEKEHADLAESLLLLFVWIERTVSGECTSLYVQAADITGTKKVVVGILETCFEAGDWKALNEQIVLLSKRRAQLKQVQSRLAPALEYWFIASPFSVPLSL
jgi:hypothetical protein